ncbi:MAG TPA: hypothetical protein VNP72_09400, partial [Longimicrobium sp.]|nr:hypothetical protein [Longimicrobium sp.]
MQKFGSTLWTRVLAAALLLPLAACGGDAGAEEKSAKGKGAAKQGQQAETTPKAPAIQSAHGTTAAQAQQCLQRRQAALDSAASALQADSTAPRPGAGKNPIFAKEQGWYPRMPEFRDGAILPCKRVVVYYGNPSSRRMGALGEFPRDEMLARLNRQAEAWRQADPGTPVVPGLHLIAVVAQSDAGPSGHYRAQIKDVVVDSIYQMAKSINGILFIDVQVGTDDIRTIMPRFEEFLKRPEVHFAVDPEFYMRGGVVPGRRIGTMYAADINYVMDQLTRIVR